MIDRSELHRIAQARLKDAAALLRARRYNGAVYLCGFAIEVRLKARICKTLRWTDFPQTRGEFENFQSLRTHNLSVLLRLSGIESRIKHRFTSEWALVAAWNPDIRYNPIGTMTVADARRILRATETLLKAI